MWTLRLSGKVLGREQEIFSCEKGIQGDFPGGRSLDRRLKSHVLCGAAKKKKI